MMKKLLSMALTVAMVSAMSIPAFAADGDAATAPKGTTNTDGSLKVSTGAAKITSDGTDWNTEDDDDALAKAADLNGADINVWAKVIDASTPTYKIDIAWGAMKFEYSSGEGTWNTTTHKYDGATGAGAWTEANYVDGTNNKITVTNHSNKAVDAAFAYAMEADAFNANATANSSVVGNFFEDNAKAVTASTVLDDTSTVIDKLAGSEIKLHTADKYYASDADKTTGDSALTDYFSDANKVATGRELPVYFAFSGKPDQGKGATLSSFQKVGVITVTVAPADVAGFEF